ncbi:hypothetical protein AVEN_235193-3 [Araneus ventricosus]|uniref:Uncharacterized protein n=1 Tax=Araneus ventricosus TaxID=182803 RepID=A0A4Y2PVD6_ARAVE|nr:hypothetical protein AVEN_235193-3 [Araneus ventricosus]
MQWKHLQFLHFGIDFYFIVTHLVKSDIVIKKERLKSILSDKLLRDNYLPQLISKEDENIVRKRRSELIKFIKIRNTPDESPAKKNTTQESISEPETREPVSKDYEVVSPVVDTFEEYKEDYGIFDEIKESEKLGRFIRHLTSLRKLQRRKKRAPPAPTTAVASNQPTTSTELCTTEETEQSGESGDTQATGESGSPEDTKSTDETAQTEDTKATGQSGANILAGALGAAVPAALGALKDVGVLSKGIELLDSLGVMKALNPTYKAGADFLAEGKAGGTIEPSTFMIALQPYTVPDDLLGTGIGSTGTTNEDTETAGSDSTGTTNEGTETNKAAAEFRAAMPAGGSDSIGAINEDTETGGEASDVFSFMIADPNKARFDRMAYDQDSSGIANSDTAVLDGGAYDEDTSVFQDPDSSPLLRKSSRDLHLRKDDEDAFRLNPFRNKTQYKESRSNAKTSKPENKVKLDESFGWRSENRTIQQQKYDGTIFSYLIKIIFSKIILVFRFWSASSVHFWL